MQNLDVDQFTLSEEELKSISALNVNLRVRVRLFASGGCGTDVCACSSTTRLTLTRAWASSRESTGPILRGRSMKLCVHCIIRAVYILVPFECV